MQRVNFCTATEEGILVSQRSLSISEGIDIADLRNVRNDYSSPEGPSQQLLTDFDGNFFAVDTEKELVATKRIVDRFESDATGMHSYTDGYELILRDRDSGDLSAVEFNRDGSQRTDALPLDTFDIQKREIELQRDLDNNGVVGLQLQAKIFPSNYQFNTAHDSIDDDLCVYLATDGSVILSRVELSVPDQDTLGMTDAYGDGARYTTYAAITSTFGFRDSNEAPTLSFCAMLMKPLQLNDGNSTIRAIQKVCSPVIQIWLMP